MSNDRLSRLERPAVQGYLSMLQGIINRMAGNSASCKTWTVTLVTALLVLVVEKDIRLPNPYLCLLPYSVAILVRLLLFRFRAYHYWYSDGLPLSFVRGLRDVHEATI